MLTFNGLTRPPTRPTNRLVSGFRSTRDPEQPGLVAIAPWPLAPSGAERAAALDPKSKRIANNLELARGR